MTVADVLGNLAGSQLAIRTGPTIVRRFLLLSLVILFVSLIWKVLNIRSPRLFHLPLQFLPLLRKSSSPLPNTPISLRNFPTGGAARRSSFHSSAVRDKQGKGA